MDREEKIVQGNAVPAQTGLTPAADVEDTSLLATPRPSAPFARSDTPIPPIIGGSSLHQAPAETLLGDNNGWLLPKKTFKPPVATNTKKCPLEAILDTEDNVDQAIQKMPPPGIHALSWEKRTFQEANWPYLPLGTKPTTDIHPSSLLHKRAKTADSSNGSATSSLAPQEAQDVTRDSQTAPNGPVLHELTWEDAKQSAESASAVPPPAPITHAAGPAVSATPAMHRPKLPCTPTPQGGFPDVFIDFSDPAQDNQVHDQATVWDNLDDNDAIVAVVHSSGILSTNRNNASVLIPNLTANVINDYLGITNIWVSTPKPLDASVAANGPPHRLLIFGTTRRNLEILLKQRCLSTPSITMSFKPKRPFLPYICSIEGLMNQDPQAIRDIILEHLQHRTNALKILHVASQFPPLRQLSLHNAFSAIIKLITIMRLDALARGEVPTPIYNIYGDLPSDDRDIWSAWRDLFVTLDYQDDFMGLRRLRVFAPCGICHGCDHFRGLCPFPQIDGWNGPKLPERPFSKNSSSQRRTHTRSND